MGERNSMIEDGIGKWGKVTSLSGYLGFIGTARGLLVGRSFVSTLSLLLLLYMMWPGAEELADGPRIVAQLQWARLNDGLTPLSARLYSVPVRFASTTFIERPTEPQRSIDRSATAQHHIDSHRSQPSMTRLLRTDVNWTTPSVKMANF
jgi:hypothetical protein